MSTSLAQTKYVFAGFTALDIIFPQGSLARASTQRILRQEILYRPGGPPNAAAIGVGKLVGDPSQVAIITAIGGTSEEPDDHGTILLKLLARTGLNTDGMSYMPDQSTTHVLVNTPSSGPNKGKRGFDVYHGTMSSFGANSIDYAALGSGEGRFFGLGSPGLLPELERDNGAGIKTVLESTKNLGFTNTLGTAYCSDGEGRRRLDAALPYIDVLSTSQKEIEHYTGKTIPQEAARYFHQAGVKKVFITLGPKGALYSIDGGKSGIVAPFGNFDITDRTGCGDLSWAALVVGLSEGLSFPEAASLANDMGHYIAFRSEGALGAPDRSTLTEWARNQKGD